MLGNSRSGRRNIATAFENGAEASERPEVSHSRGGGREPQRFRRLAVTQALEMPH